MTAEDKVCLKESVMGLVSNGIRPILDEESHIKNMIARIVVEMIKREWPQHWPDMLNELDMLTKFGEAQTELVLFVLLRLAEDVVTFQALPAQRRREIQSTMTLNMDRLFAFMLNILQQSVQHYQQLKADPGNTVKAQGLCRVALAALNTLAGYIDWVSVIHITEKNCKLLEMLCVLLSEPELQLEAAECLLIAVSRKGKMEDRVPLLVLLGDEPIQYILSVAQMVHGGKMQEKHYVFLKRLCQVLCALGSQICSLTLAPDIKVKTPGNFGKYLDSLLSFTKHPSQFLVFSTLATWGSIFRHEVLSRDPQLLAVVPEFLRAAMVNMAKVGCPSRDDSPSCEYSRLDFDSDEDFSSFFNSFRATMGDVVRAACRLDPKTGFRIAEEWMKYVVSQPLSAGPNNLIPSEGLCGLQSPALLQWDAMTFFSECVTGQMFRTLHKEEVPVTEGISLLQKVLAYETNDPFVLSYVLTNLSSLFPFVTYVNTYVSSVLSKLLAAVTFELPADRKVPRSRSVKNVRRHACSSLIKISRDYPDLLLPHFDLLYTSVRTLLGGDQSLTQMEKCALIEVIVLVSNQLKNYEQQRNFLDQLLHPIISIWLSEEIQRAVSGPDEFISYVGAAMLGYEQKEEELYRVNHYRLCFCCCAMLAVVKRARWPNDLEEAKSGGFLSGLNDLPLYRNPCTGVVLKVLDSLLALIRTHNHLNAPEVLAKTGDWFRKAMDLSDFEKKTILGLFQPVLDLYEKPVNKTPLDRIQIFFCTMIDSCYQFLGNCGPSLQHDFYSIADLGPRLLRSAFSNLDGITDFRLRAMLRVFVKPFILSCPPEKYESLICPIFGPLLTYLHQRLSHKWLMIKHRTLVSEEENCESQEVLDDQVMRLLTRDVVDLIVACCVTKKSSDNNVGLTDGLHGAGQAPGEDDEMMGTESVAPGSLELTELGKVLMANEEVSAAVLVLSYSPLVWTDTIACQKAASQLCWTLFKQVLSGVLPSDTALCFFSNVLCGLQTHGQHESVMVVLV
ncbi:hypothetical protein GDO86_018630, partial [Hymenochirus boettgeri]